MMTFFDLNLLKYIFIKFMYSIMLCYNDDINHSNYFYLAKFTFMKFMYFHMVGYNEEMNKALNVVEIL
jgi:hypothetical protein